jgi:hypothetical protein
MTNAAVIETPVSEAERALDRLSLDVRRALHDERVEVLRQGVLAIVPLIESGDLDPVAVEDEIYQIANDYGLGGAAGSEHEREIAEITTRLALAHSMPRLLPRHLARKLQGCEATIQRLLDDSTVNRRIAVQQFAVRGGCDRLACA